MFSYMRRGRAFYLDVAKLALPIVLQNLITTSLGVIDTMMVGTLGELSMAAVAVANLPIFVIQLVIFGLQSGSSVLISQYWGKGDRESISRVLGIGIYVAGGISILFALLMTLFPSQLMGLLSNDQAAVELAAQYGRIVGPSYILASLSGVYLGAARSMENPALGLKVFSASMCTNTFLNWVLIFGNLGAPALGVQGAAVATFCSRVVEFIIVLIYATRSRRFRIHYGALRRPGGQMLQSFMRYSGPVVFNETMWGIGFSLYRVIMGHMENSTPILAARALAGSVEDFCQVAVFGVAASSAIIVGREIGAGRRETIYEVGAALNTLGFIVGFVVGLFTLGLTWFVLPTWIYPMFEFGAESSQITTMMVTFTGATMWLRAMNATNVVGVLRGGGDVQATMRIDTMPMWLVALPLAALFGLVLEWGIFWVYVGITMENVVKCWFSVTRFRSRAWINDVTIPSAEMAEASPANSAEK